MEEVDKRFFYYVSDVHLEYRNEKDANSLLFAPTVENARNFLALCGDIGNPFDPKYSLFIARHSLLFEKVFVVAGNHEYYSKKKKRTMFEVQQKLKEVCGAFANVFFLDMNVCEIDEDIVVAGSTFWTKTDAQTEYWMRDYDTIHFDQTRLLKWSDVCQFHESSLKWLTDVCAEVKTQKKKLIVLTHHAPSFVMWDKAQRNAISEGNNFNKQDDFKQWANESTKFAYASQSDHLFVEPVITWISGHIHESQKRTVNNIPCLSNCLGYPGQKGVNVNKQEHFIFYYRSFFAY